MRADHAPESGQTSIDVAFTCEFLVAETWLCSRTLNVAAHGCQKDNTHKHGISCPKQIASSPARESRGHNPRPMSTPRATKSASYSVLLGGAAWGAAKAE